MKNGNGIALNFLDNLRAQREIVWVLTQGTASRAATTRVFLLIAGALG